MSYENAKANLKEFGKAFNLEGLQFDENYSCILSVDCAQPLHAVFEPLDKKKEPQARSEDTLPGRQ